MVISETVRRYILVGFVLFIAVGLIASKMMASKQDEQFAYEDAVFQQGMSLYNEENYTEALVYAEELLKTQGDSESVNYFAALVAMENGQFSRATTLMQKTLDINPYKVDYPMFMLQFGESLNYAERFDDAKLVLERCRDMGWVPEQFPKYQEHVAQLLTALESK